MSLIDIFRSKAVKPIEEIVPTPIEINFDHTPLDVEQRTLTQNRKPDLSVAVGPLPLSMQLLRIGGNLRPSDVSQIIIEADSGVTTRLMDLANEARQKDCHLHGVLFTRETTLASLPWQIEPYAKQGKKSVARDRAIADFVEETLSSIYGAPSVSLGAPDDLVGFRGMLAHLGGAPYYGFAPVEVVWGKNSGDLIPIGFSNLQQRRFIFNQSDGRLCWYDEGSPRQVDVMREYPPGKFVVHRPRIVGDVPCREGLARPLMWAALFRNWDIRDWMALGELAWKPYRTGYYTREATPNDIENLIQALKRVSSTGTAAFPETTKFQIEWPKHSVSSGQSMHGELAAFFGGEMSKCVLGQTLTTEAGQKGARALGEVHDGVRKDIAESDAIQAAATIQAQLIVPLVRMNFGVNANVPKFTFVTDQIADIETFSAGVLNLRKSAVRIPEKWVRDRVGMPKPDEDDEIVGEGVDVPIDPTTGLPLDPTVTQTPSGSSDAKPTPTPASDSSAP